MKRELEDKVLEWMRTRSAVTAWEIEVALLNFEGMLGAPVVDQKLRRARRLMARLRARGEPIVTSRRGFRYATGEFKRNLLAGEIYKILREIKRRADAATELVLTLESI